MYANCRRRRLILLRQPRHLVSREEPLNESIATTGIYANTSLDHLEDEMWRFDAPRRIDEGLTNGAGEAEGAEGETA